MPGRHFIDRGTTPTTMATFMHTWTSMHKSNTSTLSDWATIRHTWGPEVSLATQLCEHWVSATVMKHHCDKLCSNISPPATREPSEQDCHLQDDKMHCARKTAIL